MSQLFTRAGHTLGWIREQATWPQENVPATVSRGERKGREGGLEVLLGKGVLADRVTPDELFCSVSRTLHPVLPPNGEQHVLRITSGGAPPRATSGLSPAGPLCHTVLLGSSPEGLAWEFALPVRCRGLSSGICTKLPI